MDKNRNGDWKGSALVCALMVVLMLPFVQKPINIDETTYIWIARQILENPLQPYGFDANWFGFQQPMAQISQSPPLVSYYLAVVGAIWGWDETTLHLSFMVPALFLVLGIYRLSVLLGSRPVQTTGIAILSPVMVVSATSLMLDTTMVAFYVWAIVYWVAADDGRARLNRRLSCLMICLGLLTKYFAITLVPLLAAYSILKNKRLNGSELLYLCIPVVAMGLLEHMTAPADSANHLMGAFSFLFNRSLATFSLSGKILTGMVFLGGSLLPFFFLAPIFWNGKTVWLWGASVLITSALFYIAGQQGPWALFKIYGSSLGLAVFSSLLFVGGVHAVALAMVGIVKNRDPEITLLTLWFLGTIAFSLFVNWAINVRTLLPALPPIAILAIRRLQALGPKHDRFCDLRKPVGVLLAVVLTVLVTYADFASAFTQKRAATAIINRYASSDKTIWFQGHWGFQYYMESMGAKPFDFHQPKVRTGEKVVVPLNNTNVRYLPEPPFKIAARFKISSGQWVSVMDYSKRVGYHAGDIGGLPYCFGRIPLDEYVIYELVK